AAAVEGNLSAEDIRRPVVRVGMRHAARAPRPVVELRTELRELARVLVVLAAHGEGQAPAGGDDDAGGDDLHVALVDVAGGERLDAIVRMIGAIGQAPPGVE